MDIGVVIYGIIGAFAILVCWLLDIYSPTIEKRMYSPENLRTEKSPVILPTCCICLKIRDEKGNWHERNDYQADYQGVIFSHTFCPECASIHYAGFYQGTEQEMISTNY